MTHESTQPQQAQTAFCPRCQRQIPVDGSGEHCTNQFCGDPYTEIRDGHGNLLVKPRDQSPAESNLIGLFDDHYWGSLEKDKDIILLHVRSVLRAASQGAFAGGDIASDEHDIAGHAANQCSEPGKPGVDGSIPSRSTKPVAWRYQRKEGWGDIWRTTPIPVSFETLSDWTIQPLYTHPQSQPAIGLRQAVTNLFAGGFIDAGTRLTVDGTKNTQQSEWAQELECRLKPIRAALDGAPAAGNDTADLAAKLRESHQNNLALWEAIAGGPQPRCRDCADFNGRCQGNGLPCDPQARALEQITLMRRQVEGMRNSLNNSQNLLRLICRLNTHGSVDEYDWEGKGLGDLIPKQIAENTAALTSTVSPSGEEQNV